MSKRPRQPKTVSCASGIAFSPLSDDTDRPVSHGFNILTFNEYKQFQHALRRANDRNIIYPSLHDLGLSHLASKFYLIGHDDLVQIYSSYTAARDQLDHIRDKSPAPHEISS